MINNLNTNTSIGTPVRFIKLSRNNISEALAEVINLSLAQGVVPDIIKISKVIPVYKGGESFDPVNYRPISILSSFSQIFEKLVQKQLISYVEKHEILTQCQFGFRKNHSTEQAIAEITDNFKKSIDNNLFTCGIFLDFAKAFDTVNHTILLGKLEKYGIRGIPLKWFTSYLTNRQQYVSIDNIQSSKQTVICGIPQGSSLGPLLFLIYINNIINSSQKLSFRLFADDTNILASSDDPTELESNMNMEFKNVKLWCDANKLSINLKKTHFMLIKSAQKRLSIPFHIAITDHDDNNYSLEQKDHVKYLGVMIDDKLNWKYHISFVCTRISRNTGVFYKLRHFFNSLQSNFDKSIITLSTPIFLTPLLPGEVPIKHI